MKMRRISKVIGCLCVLGCVLCGPAFAGAADLAAEIAKVVDAVKPESMRMGIRIVELQSQAVVYTHRADEACKPASNMKLLTTAAALDLLPASYKFRTTLAMRGDDLIVLGSGDPSLGDPRLAQDAGEPITAIFHDWAAKLEALGIVGVPGDLVIDDTVFEAERYHPNWPKSGWYNWYSAPVGGLNLNDNCIDVTVAPGAKPGEPAVIRVVPPNTFTEIVNECKTGDKQTATIRRVGNEPKYIVSGLSKTAGELKSVAVHDPGMLFASSCRTSLAAKGIKIHGTIRRERVRDDRGNLPPGCRVIAVYERPMTDLLGRINKNSQNLFAECLLKTIGFQLSATETGVGDGSYTAGQKYVRRFLEKIQAPDLSKVVIDDGSGLSHGNRVTAHMLNHVICHMARHARATDYLGSLSVAGEDGTLKTRMKDLKGQVRAKTGYISGVYALSGFARSKDGKTYAFTMLFNDVRPGSVNARKVQDDICRVLVNGAGK
ncbi:MAG: D-alanyl-D-alanine carboxypeptidase/D-alanyl-D-alanine-endopeptidase [Phycisphaerae bacterium]|nr:D-alanyl-D-alanine carboxypeptidase/D-alanyl-D-alanine-endopeptidase [Phycisphaerae bacterium]